MKTALAQRCTQLVRDGMEGSKLFRRHFGHALGHGVQFFHDVLPQCLFLVRDRAGCVREKTDRPGGAVADRHDQAMNKPICLGTFKNTGRILIRQRGPVTGTEMAHAPKQCRVREQEPVLGIVEDPFFGIGLIHEGRMVEPDAKADGKAPIAVLNQTLQLRVYLLVESHVQATMLGLDGRLNSITWKRNRDTATRTTLKRAICPS